jgi:Na+-transporting NADH:ubiquinone oxidoreductase subunit NqrC
MSVVRAIQPISPIAPRRHLRPVPASTSPRVTAAPKTISRTNVAAALRVLSPKIIGGVVLIIILNIFLSSLSNASIYKISQLKKEAATLGTQTQIINQEVASLRSPQNLANSAMALGMVVNSNPVFLSVKQSRVFGSSSPASANNSGVSNNLIANAALITRSNPSKYAAAQKAKIDVPTVVSVKTVKSPDVQVVLPSDGIPASPTH